MENKLKVTIPIAILITLIAIIYQRTTGPTYPKKFKFEHAGQTIKIKLPRSQENTQGALVNLPSLDNSNQGFMSYRRFPTNDSWTTVELKNENNHLNGQLPVQPAAGKLQYFIELKDSSGTLIKSFGSENEPILIRYKGPVSTWILAPHIFFMFFSMLLSALAGAEGYFKTQLSRKVGFVVLGCLFVGGMILGPMVQKAAFGVYWAGFPYDWDLTDNKLLLAFLAWLFACIANFKTLRPKALIAAAIVLIAMYSIPHSTMGSQYNYEKGQIETDK